VKRARCLCAGLQLIALILISIAAAIAQDMTVEWKTSVCEDEISSSPRLLLTRNWCTPLRAAGPISAAI
jgi:hypothetical protein